MTNSILINKYIYERLSKSPDLQKLVGNKIYPLVAENTTTYPFITYFRDGINPISFTKDGYCQDEVYFTINVVNDKYTDTLTIANIVRKLMEGLKLSNDEATIFDTHMTSIDENFVENAYVQTMQFTCKFEN